ncbi:hypothetical protein [Nocardia carnea]|nr:hypothetical protein [Nocardia carnea]
MHAREPLPVRVRGEAMNRMPTAWALLSLAHLELIREALRRWADEGEHA